MSAFTDQLAADLAGFFDTDEFAETITYAGTAIPAIVEYVKAESGQSVKHEAVITVKASDVPVPAYRTAVAINAASWVTGQPEECEGDGHIWKIPLGKAERPNLR